MTGAERLVERWRDRAQLVGDSGVHGSGPGKATIIRGCILELEAVVAEQRQSVVDAIAFAREKATEWDDSRGGLNVLVGGLLATLGCEDLDTRMPGAW